MAASHPSTIKTYTAVAAGGALPYDTVQSFQDEITAIETGLQTITTYTPTWTGTVTNPVVNNGTLSGRYMRAGKIVFLDIQLTIGSTTTFGSGAWGFALPLTAKDTTGQSMTVNILDSGTQFYTGSTYMFSTSVVYVAYQGDTGSSISSATPMTWATGDILRISGFYFLP
jgi:hypothetical protein